ncbi:unnamed protein product [Chondrus crispus]|uniref:Uncharacterized protein n=1 Tax=Chondrus crispus TaxID=2769 RepID=R7QBX2_CHOCR|nr:unnamed protein product [Chondrus crispus]CDF35298.1 unnamed protein product [Chondrus crispus]|eukprot:XP_005715117.1 unnamed protein product [Chondrus crispus]
MHYIDTQPATSNPLQNQQPPQQQQQHQQHHQQHHHQQNPTLQSFSSAAVHPPALQNSSPHHDPNVQVALDGRPASSKPSPSPKNSTVDASSPQGPTCLVNVRNASSPSAPQRKLHNSPPPKSSPLSGSSTRPRVPTARCSLCGKNISTNGANFRRHEDACRRQRSERVSSARPPPSAVVTNQHQNQRQQQHQQNHQQHQQQQQHQQHQQHQQQHQQPVQSEPAQLQRGSQSSPVPTQQQPTGMSRRDSDLLNVVRRLESSIHTLDVSARLCLRDALVSLSNKASNPNVPPTPEQEAMNRAAEYLVLRMLFLSGQQVVHTAPGTVGPTYPPDPQTGSPLEGMASRSIQANCDMGMGPGRPNAPKDDGTVAASTGTGGATVGKQENSVGGSPLRSSSKVEDKLADGT